MAGIKKWTNVRIAIQTALGAVVAITALTADDTPTAGAVAHPFEAGDYILLKTNGMQEMNNTVQRVASVTADAFILADQDTTGFEPFISGTAEKITFGQSFGTITQVSPSGGDTGFLDTTTIHASSGSQIPGVNNPLTYSLDSFWDIDNEALNECRKASVRQEARAFLFTFADGQRMGFLGYVGYKGAPLGQAQQIITAPIAVAVQGEPTYLKT